MFSIPYNMNRSMTPETWAGSAQCALFRWSYAAGKSAAYNMYGVNLPVGNKEAEASFFPPSADAYNLVHLKSQPTTSTTPAGLGYWLYVYDDAGMPLPHVTGSLLNSEYEIGLFNGWNMVGNPFTTQLSWSSAYFSRGGELLTYSQAISRGLIKDLIYRYDGVSGQYIGSALKDAVLAPWESQWILVRPYGASGWPYADMTVIFPNPGT
jgi:hypothetical protein